MHILYLFLPLLIATSQALASEDVKSLPSGWDSSPPPKVVGFDPNAVIAAARNAIGSAKGSVALIPMNSRASDYALVEIMEGLKDLHSRGEPAVCLSKDANIVADAVGRTLKRYTNLNLAGQSIVIAAPNQPPVEFVNLLKSRKLQYYYLEVVPGY